MQSHKKNFIALLIVTALFVAIMAIGFVGNLRSGNYVVIPIAFTAIAICAGAVWLAHYRVRVMLRDRTPDRIIAHYHGSVRRIEHANAVAAYLSGLAATFFGQFDRARAELDAVDWDKVAPMCRGHRLYVLAMLALLEETDYPQALRLAAQAKELESQSPGGGLVLLDDVIHLVAEGGNPEIVARLERAANKQHGLVPGICAWALAVYYKRNNQPDKASDYKAILKLSIPYSAPMKS
ncbi:MAG: hypothetical protein ABSB15_18170 [Bryobacteraceae bacterium]